MLFRRIQKPEHVLCVTETESSHIHKQDMHCIFLQKVIVLIFFQLLQELWNLRGQCLP